MELANFQLPMKESRRSEVLILQLKCRYVASFNLIKLQAERDGSSGLAPRWKLIKGGENGEMQAVSVHAGKNATSQPQPGKGATSVHRVQSQPLYNGVAAAMAA